MGYIYLIAHWASQPRLSQCIEVLRGDDGFIFSPFKRCTLIPVKIKESEIYIVKDRI